MVDIAPSPIEIAVAPAAIEGTTWYGNPPFVLAVLVTIILATFITMLVFVEIPEKNQSVLYSLGGQLVAGWLMGMGYFWNSSATSKVKDATIATLTTTVKDKLP
jgi:hypothetical protein